MKKHIALLLVLALLFSLAACGAKESVPTQPPVPVTIPEDEPVILPEVPSAVWPQLATPVGYWEMIRIDSDDPDLNITEAKIAEARKQGVPMYLELMEDGMGVFCFEEVTAITWNNDSISVVGDETFSYEISNNRLMIDMRELTCVFRRVDMPYSRTSEMEDAGFTEFMEEGEPYLYTTICSEDESKLTTGEASVIAYEIFESADGYEAKAGYEWRVVTFEVRFFDKNAQAYGAYVFHRFEDYYCPQLHDDSLVDLDESEGYYSCVMNRIFCGQEVETYMRTRDSWSSWRKNSSGTMECFYNIEFAFQVPEGYDGAVAVLANGSYEDADCYITEYEPDPEQFLLFRLN